MAAWLPAVHYYSWLKESCNTKQLALTAWSQVRAAAPKKNSVPSAVVTAGGLRCMRCYKQGHSLKVANVVLHAGFSHELKDKPIGVDMLGTRIVLFRDSEGKVQCMQDACPHRCDACFNLEGACKH